MRFTIVLLAASMLSACATEAERLERATALAEKREQYAYERYACELNVRTAWICTSPNKRANENYPWLHCSCTENGTVLR
ncbi:MAG: hypothetical protein QNJ00_18535 [Woeseiaceae bacterium]|nr:hypothetical protein [Woeseiaceae bacterium]